MKMSVAGKTFSFALGKTQFLYIGDGELVREMNLCKSLDLGKPSYMYKERGPLLGKGILTTSKEVWVHQRKTIAPTIYVDKVKVHFYLDCFGTCTNIVSLTVYLS